MKIEILLFAQLKEAYGSERLWLEVPDNTRVADAVRRVMEEASLRLHAGLPLRYAVNEEFRPADTRLKPLDRLALLSPVAGG